MMKKTTKTAPQAKTKAGVAKKSKSSAILDNAPIGAMVKATLAKKKK